MDSNDIPSDDQDLSAINTATAGMILNPDPQNDDPEDDEHAAEDEEEIDDELAAQGLLYSNFVICMHKTILHYWLRPKGGPAKKSG